MNCGRGQSSIFKLFPTYLKCVLRQLSGLHFWAILKLLEKHDISTFLSIFLLFSYLFITFNCQSVTSSGAFRYFSLLLLQKQRSPSLSQMFLLAIFKSAFLFSCFSAVSTPL